MEVGRYYMDKSNHVAAINRFKTVVTDYQTTAHVEEALYRLTVAYMSLGIAPEAQNAAAVLGHNFPNSQLVQGFLRAAAEAGPDAAGQPGLVDDRRAAGPGEGARRAAGRQGRPGRRPIGRRRRPSGAEAPPGPPPPSTLGGPST